MEASVIPNRETFHKLSRKYETILVKKELGKITPERLLVSLNPERSFVFEREGFLACGELEEQVSGEDPLRILSDWVQKERWWHTSLPFCGGVIGYVGYDASFLGSREKQDPVSLPSVALFRVRRFYLLTDGKLHAVCCANSDYSSAVEELERMSHLPQGCVREQKFSCDGSNVSRREFLEMVRKVKEMAKKGRVRQVIVSRKFFCTVKDPLTVFLQLRRLNPCPYRFYLRWDGKAVLGSSPENFLTIRGRVAESSPVASTRGRGKTSAEDRRLERELKTSPKEREEHMMLLRQCVREFKAVCREVRILERSRVKKFPFFMHLVSRIRGTVDRPYDLLVRTFPSATIVGVPKEEAARVIKEIEPDARGAYCGIFGNVFPRFLDTGIIVRCVLVNGERAVVPVGAGIVSRSDPESEYRETFIKARPQLSALGAQAEDLEWLSEL